eukprot:CAMPEP_0171384650 /NCGR_PEP_ID=MMETSP0879-20121228/38581_1 /TAXON_ID=67004 /ORGANISM="Thalassiosira weissflogii, Strain CCMP1336" /LENGTH=480 /DNA_ID=CAMNT_0011896929 /DNA_START=79 /DNA_END=1521 /DNA_ORIENTATION=+
MRIATTAVATFALLSATHAFIPSTTYAPIRITQIYAEDITGTVKWYNELRGFGFIEVDDGGPDMYVHATGLTFDGPLVDGERVSFATEIDRRTNKPKAVNVYREAPVEVVDSEPVEKPVVEAAVSSEEPVAVAEPVEEVVPAIAAEEVVEKANINIEELQAKEAFQRLLLQAKLAEDQKCRQKIKSIEAEKTQRALLEAQLSMNSKRSRNGKQVIDEAAIAAARKMAVDAEKFQLEVPSEELVAVAEPIEVVVPIIAAEEVVQKANINIEELQAKEAFQRLLLQAKLAEDQKCRQKIKSIEAEKTQRALLEAQLSMNSKRSRNGKQVIDEAAIAAARKKAVDAELFQQSLLAEKFKNDKIINQQKKAAAEEAARIEAEKAAEEARLAEVARLAKEADEKRIAEEKAAAEAARLAREKEEAVAKELGYSSFENMMTRQQPKSKEEEAALAQKYGAIENVGERAYAILKDLGAVEETVEPQV